METEGMYNGVSLWKWKWMEEGVGGTDSSLMTLLKDTGTWYYGEATEKVSSTCLRKK